MSMKGWAIALLLSPFTLGMSVVAYFYIWFFTKIGKFYIKAMTWSIKAAIGIIAWPFKVVADMIGGTFHFFELMYYQGAHNLRRAENTKHKERANRGKEGYQNGGEEESEGVGFVSGMKSGMSFVTKYKFRYIALFGFVLWFFNYPSFVMSLLQDPTQLMTLAGFLDFLPMLLMLALPFIIVIFISALAFEFLGDGTKFYKASEQAVENAKTLGAAGAAVGAGAAGAAADAGKAAEATAGAAKAGAEMGTTAVTTASHLQTAGEMAGIEGEAAGLAGLVEGSAVASALSTALPVVAVLAIAWFVYTLIAGAISLVLVAITWGYIAKLLPMFAGALMPAIGLGEAYGQWFGQSTANTLAPQLGSMFAEEKRMLAQMGAKMGCALKGPQCLRQWRMNNTVRPGSESRGETYELRIDRFGLAQEKIDVAYKEKNYPLPVNFLVYNTRHGLKGIRARNVKYRILVEDSSNQGENAYCDTEWTSINTSSGDYIIPGLGVSPTKTLETINLGNCGLLQPSMGVNRVLTMQVMYDYSSQATLYFDAMSRKNRREQGITPSFKKSKTAKTPVQSYINIQAPVTYYETEEGQREAVPFPARFGFETPGFDIKYHVDPSSIEIDDSVLTEHLDDSCRGLGDKDGDNEYTISNRADSRITSRQSPTRWFTKGVNPAPLRCTFQLTDEGKNSINPTGEQLLMRIDANYTIVREKQHSSFSVVNTKCSRINCPMLVTQSYNETNEDTFLYTECTYTTSVDVRGGCTVIDAKGKDGIDWNSVSKSDLAQDSDGTPLIIKQGQTAYRWSEWVGSGEDKIDKKHIFWTPPSDILGMRKEKMSKMVGGANGALIVRDKRNEFADPPSQYCNENEGGDKEKGLKQYAEAFESHQFNEGDVLYFNPVTTNCDNDSYFTGLLSGILSEPVTYEDWEKYCEARGEFSDDQNNPDAGESSVVVKSGASLSCYHNAD